MELLHVARRRNEIIRKKKKSSLNKYFYKHFPPLSFSSSLVVNHFLWLWKVLGSIRYTTFNLYMFPIYFTSYLIYILINFSISIVIYFFKFSCLTLSYNFFSISILCGTFSFFIAILTIILIKILSKNLYEEHMASMNSFILYFFFFNFSWNL